MYMRTLLISSVLALAGCQSADVITQSGESSEVSSAQSLSFHKMKVPSSMNVAIGADTQVLNSALVSSPVAAFELPANRGKLEIKITSQIEETVFSPLVLILDKEGKVIDSYDSSVFEYRRAKLIFGDRLVADIDFYPPTGHETVYMIVYTSKEELEGQTFVVHPARAMAEAKGNHMPEMKDIPKPHTTTGTLLVEIDGASTAYVAQEPAAAQKTEYKKIQPQKESAEFYKSAIRQAVEENNIPKALSLLEEAKALNIEGAQETFVTAINDSRAVN